MKKLYVDDILSKTDKANPGPGRYDQQKHFGKYGKEYTFAGRLKRYERSLKDSKKLPGPGAYETVDLCGRTYNNSHFTTAKNFSIGKESRFQIPTKKWMNVSPATYKPMDNFNEDYKSNFRKTAHTVFGKNQFSVLD
jgi:hypothetical protein